MTARDSGGTYAGDFTLPDGRKAHGVLELQVDAPPSLGVKPETATPVGPEGRSFPQESAADVVIGSLHTNEAVVLGDAHVSEWFPNQFLVSSRWGLVGLSVDTVPECSWTKMRAGFSGMETILGNAIKSTSWPPDAETDPQTYGASIERESRFISRSGPVEVTASYDNTVKAFDPFEFRLTSFPAVTFEADSPLTVDEWIDGWLNPMLGLLTLATGEQESVLWAHLSIVDPDPGIADLPVAPEITATLWGSGIHQDRRPASLRTHRDGSSLQPAFLLSEAPPLAEMVARWRSSLADTASAGLYRLALDAGLPLQVRFLMCAQALEGLDAHDQMAAEALDDKAYLAARKNAVAEVASAEKQGCLSNTSRKFVKRYLPKAPPRSLASRLSRVIGSAQVSDERKVSWLALTEPLMDELRASGRQANSLEERLAAARNSLSHGDTLAPEALRPAVRILEILLRGQLLQRLGFDSEQLGKSYERMVKRL